MELRHQRGGPHRGPPDVGCQKELDAAAELRFELPVLVCPAAGRGCDPRSRSKEQAIESSR